MNQSDSIDVSEMPEILRLVEAASASGESFALLRGSQVIATVQPVAGKRTPPRRGPLTEEQIDKAMSAAGSWQGMDSQAFIEQIYATREADSRPPDHP